MVWIVVSVLVEQFVVLSVVCEVVKNGINFLAFLFHIVMIHVIHGVFGPVFIEFHSCIYF